MFHRRSTPSPSSETLSRLNRHFASCAAIAAGVALFGFTNKSDAAVVYSGPENISTAGVQGVYIDFKTNTIGTSATDVPGWDIVLSTGTVNPGTGPVPDSEIDTQINSTTHSPTAFVLQSGYAQKLDAGVTVGPSAEFSTSSVIGIASSLYPYSPWHSGATDKFIGVKFTAADTTSHYAWVELDFNPTTQVSTIEGFASESTPGNDIVTGDTGASVPEPSSAVMLGLLAMGAVGVRSRRRKTV